MECACRYVELQGGKASSESDVQHRHPTLVRVHSARRLAEDLADVAQVYGSNRHIVGDKGPNFRNLVVFRLCR